MNEFHSKLENINFKMCKTVVSYDGLKTADEIQEYLLRQYGNKKYQWPSYIRISNEQYEYLHEMSPFICNCQCNRKMNTSTDNRNYIYTELMGEDLYINILVVTVPGCKWEKELFILLEEDVIVNEYQIRAVIQN